MAKLFADTVASFVLAVFVTLAHGTTHFLFGSSSAFGSAAVSEAGIAVFVSAFMGALFYNTVGWQYAQALVS